jgi:hypothetical protein
VTLYGLYVRDLAAGDLVWFTTDESLEPGEYVRGRHHAHSPDVYIAESIAALVLQVGPIVLHAEDQAQKSLGTSGISSGARDRIRKEMTEGLLRRLTETSSIWVVNPSWVDELHLYPHRTQ